MVSKIRRPLTEQEFARLMGMAGPRRMLYMMKMLTGLRRSALYALTWGQVYLDSLDDLGPRVIIPAKDMKNSPPEIKVLPDILARLLLESRPKGANPSDPVFPSRPHRHVSKELL